MGVEVRLEVRFVETGEVRTVLGYCRSCATTDDSPIGWGTTRPFDWEDVHIVSPSGTVHLSHWDGCDRTACGKDATGERWWHRE